MRLLPLAAALVAARSLPAQAWDSGPARDLVARAVARRAAAGADTTLTSYQARAHGVVFFMSQVGAGLTEPPRLIKADQLEVEVYWRAPDVSKQVIVGWRDGAYLPTDIKYHRDHLAIIPNNFGDRIRLGEGDEVRDVLHPLSPAGLGYYQYALADSVTLTVGDRMLRVYAVDVRPRASRSAGTVGRLFLERTSADLVRFRFSFTAASYRDREVEDITVVLENALWEERYWLPFRQDVEIRRRVSWLDLPARSIIRGRWEIGDYRFGVAFPRAAEAGPAIGGLRAADDSSYAWSEPLADVVAGEARPVTEEDLEAVRLHVAQAVGARALETMARTRLAARSLGDIISVNRAQGLRLGAGGALRVAPSLVLRSWIGYGTSDGRVVSRAQLTWTNGAWSLEAAGRRDVRDIGDRPVITPALNSLLAQEAGVDYGDYVLLETAGLTLRRRVGPLTTLALGAAVERSRSVAVAATPAAGDYRPNPPLGAGDYALGRLSLTRFSQAMVGESGVRGTVEVESGAGEGRRYLRGALRAIVALPLGGSVLQARIDGGWASRDLPAYRSFVLGGRGTLPGEPFRAFGGRSLGSILLEWRHTVGVPALRLGTFASTGGEMVVAPLLGVGWAERGVAGAPWQRSDGLRPVGGVAVEWFHRILRLEAAVGLRDGETQIVVDLSPEWWDLF